MKSGVRGTHKIKVDSLLFIIDKWILPTFSFPLFLDLISSSWPYIKILSSAIWLVLPTKKYIKYHQACYIVLRHCGMKSGLRWCPSLVGAVYRSSRAPSPWRATLPCQQRCGPRLPSILGSLYDFIEPFGFRVAERNVRKRRIHLVLKTATFERSFLPFLFATTSRRFCGRNKRTSIVAGT